MTAFVLLIIGIIVGFGGGWFCKAKFGAKAATVVKDIAS